jgi:hypothetical protein
MTDGALTITEALAEIKTIGKRIEKKRQFVQQYIIRQEIVRDPLENQGGSKAALAAELQGIGDLEERIISLRRAIATANTSTPVSINGVIRPIQDWLTWRREVAPNRGASLTSMIQGLRNFRSEQQKKGMNVRTEPTPSPADNDVIVNVDELALAKQSEALVETLGQLDGLLSLKNATTQITL